MTEWQCHHDVQTSEQVVGPISLEFFTFTRPSLLNVGMGSHQSKWTHARGTSWFNCYRWSYSTTKRCRQAFVYDMNMQQGSFCWMMMLSVLNYFPPQNNSWVVFGQLPFISTQPGICTQKSLLQQFSFLLVALSIFPSNFQSHPPFLPSNPQAPWKSNHTYCTVW